MAIKSLLKASDLRKVFLQKTRAKIDSDLEAAGKKIKQEQGVVSEAKSKATESAKDAARKKWKKVLDAATEAGLTIQLYVADDSAMMESGQAEVHLYISGDTRSRLRPKDVAKYQAEKAASKERVCELEKERRKLSDLHYRITENGIASVILEIEDDTVQKSIADIQNAIIKKAEEIFGFQ